MIFTEEQREIQALVHAFAEKEIRPLSRKYDELGEFPMELYKKACRMQLNCLDLPEKYGGTGVSKVTSCLIREELSWGDAGFSLSLGANGLGFKPLLIAGSEAQRRHFADVLLNDGFTAFAITEPDAGSDAGSMKTTARRVGDEYILNGHKCFITNGGLADVYTVLASTDKSKGAKGLTMFIVDRDTPGLSVGKHENKMGIRLSNTADVIFHDVKVPAANIIGGEGKGFRIAMETLNQGRAGTCSSAVGLMRAAFEYAMKYAQERVTFGQPIYKNQAGRYGHKDRGRAQLRAAGRRAARQRRYASGRQAVLYGEALLHRCFAECCVRRRADTRGLRIYARFPCGKAHARCKGISNI